MNTPTPDPIATFKATYFLTSSAYKSAGQCARTFTVNVWKTLEGGGITYVGQSKDHSKTMCQMVLELLADQESSLTGKPYKGIVYRLEADNRDGIFEIVEL